MKLNSVFYRRPLFHVLKFSAWWTLIFWTLPFIYLGIEGKETFSYVLFSIPGICGTISIFAAILIYIAMWIYLIARDRNPRGNRVCWGIVFFFTGFYGSCLYFLTVYRRQFVDATRKAQLAEYRVQPM